MLKICNENYISKETIKNGFRATGLFPFDKCAPDYTKCLAENSSNPVIPGAISSDHDTSGFLTSYPVIPGTINSDPVNSGLLNSDPVMNGLVNSDPVIPNPVNSGQMPSDPSNSLDKRITISW